MTQATTPAVVAIERDGALLMIRLTDPEHGNHISNDEGDRIVAALGALPDDVKLVRITSDGDTFCLGRRSPMPPPGTKFPAERIKSLVAEPALRVYAALQQTPVPVLTVVRGAAHGYGCALAVASDVVLASETATFEVPEMQRGIPPLLVLTAMNNRVAPKTAAYLALSCDALTAVQAQAAGIVSSVVAPDALNAETDRLTATILAAPIAALRALKEYFRLAPGQPFEAAAALAANLTATALSSRFMGP